MTATQHHLSQSFHSHLPGRVEFRDVHYSYAHNAVLQGASLVLPA